MQLSSKQKVLVFETLEKHGYKYLDVLGAGGDGEVFLVKNTHNNREFAIKCFSSDRDFMRLKSIKNCNNLVYPINCIKVEKDLFIYLMEKCTPVSKSFPTTKKLLLDILDGIEQLDRNGLEQQDDFDGNILIKKNQSVAISDFSSFGNRNTESISNQIKKMILYVQKSRNIKNLTKNLTNEDMSSISATKDKIQLYT